MVVVILQGGEREKMMALSLNHVKNSIEERIHIIIIKKMVQQKKREQICGK